MLFENLYYKPVDLYDLQEQLFKQGDYEAFDFINKEIKEWESEIESQEKLAKYYETREDELAYGMRQIFNLIEDLENAISDSSRLNRKKVLENLHEIKREFNEYI